MEPSGWDWYPKLSLSMGHFCGFFTVFSLGPSDWVQTRLCFPWLTILNFALIFSPKGVCLFLLGSLYSGRKPWPAPSMGSTERTEGDICREVSLVSRVCPLRAGIQPEPLVLVTFKHKACATSWYVKFFKLFSWISSVGSKWVVNTIHKEGKENHNRPKVSLKKFLFSSIFNLLANS